MGLSDITNRQPVLDAIAECKKLGQDKFLKNYKFGRAKFYWLVYEGEWYASKAILGVAHRYAMPKLGPLRRDQFNGGKPVQGKLEKLGFKVEVVRPKA